MIITQLDEDIARQDPINNSLELRAIRVLDKQIKELEECLGELKFARAVLRRHQPIPA